MSRFYVVRCLALTLVVAGLMAIRVASAQVGAGASVFNDNQAEPSSTPAKEIREPAQANSETSIAHQAPPLDQVNDITVYALAYGHRGTKAVGSCSPVRIKVGGDKTGRVRIGFYESEVGGTGTEWRASGWMAAVTAAQLTDFNPRCLQVSFDMEGRIDGPSAGGLLTIGVLAGAMGLEVREDAAMTGTINPDGTIGPVGGIPHKLEGAAEAGKKMVLIPAGDRYQHDDNTDNQVDLIEHGRKLGLEVIPVTNIHMAFELMTGSKLPRHPSAARPRVSSSVDQQTTRKAQGWMKRMESAINNYSKLPDYAKLEQAQNAFGTASKYLARVNPLLGEGEISVAYWDVVVANVYAYLAMELGRNATTLRSGGIEKMVARVKDNDWLQDNIEDAAFRLNAELPETLDQLALYCLASDAFVEAVCCQTLAANILENLPDDLESRIEYSLEASFKQIVAWLDLQLVDDYLDMSRRAEGALIPDNAPVVELGNFYQRAAEANMAMFDALTIEELSEETGLSMDQVRARLASKDEDYGLMRATQLGSLTIMSKYLDGKAQDYAYLAAGMSMHPRAAMLIGKYYSLGAELEDFQVVSVRRERTLTEWLDYADEQARRSIGAMQSQGSDISICAQMYDIASMWRHRELDSRIRALNYFLSAQVHAEALRHLAGYSFVVDEN